MARTRGGLTRVATRDVPRRSLWLDAHSDLRYVPRIGVALVATTAAAERRRALFA